MEGNSGDVVQIPGSRRSPRGGNGHPLQFSCLGNPMDRGAWWATVHGVTQTEEPGRLLCVRNAHTHSLPVSVSFSVCVSHCISLFLSLSLSLSHSVCLSLSPCLSLPLSFSSDLRRRRTVPRKTFASHWRHSRCSVQMLLLSLMLQLVWWWRLCGQSRSQDPVPVTTDSGAPGPSWVTLTCTELWSKEHESGECFFMLHRWAKNRRVSNRREPWSCVCPLTLGRTRADPAPLTTPRLRLDGGMIGEQRVGFPVGLYWAKIQVRFFFSNIKGFMGFIDGTI